MSSIETPDTTTLQDRAPGRVAVVTGGGSGIGRAAALALAADGWSVVIAGRRQEPLDRVAAESTEATTTPTPTAAPAGAVHPVRADVSVETDVRHLFDETVALFGRVDLLFNNAGIGAPPTELDEIDLGTWNEVMAVTVTGSFLCAREAFRIMKAQDPRGGRIVNNGSISAYSPRPLSAPYTVAKHAISGLTKQLQLDGRPFDIACGQLDIGNAATSMAGGLTAGTLQADGQTRPEAVMDVAETGRALLYMANLPLGTNIANLTVMATTMPFVGRG